MTLCPACFNAVAAVRPAIPAPTMRTFSCTVLSLEPIVLMRYMSSFLERWSKTAILRGFDCVVQGIRGNCSLYLFLQGENYESGFCTEEEFTDHSTVNLSFSFDQRYRRDH